MMEWWAFPALVLCAVTFTAAAGVLVFWAVRGVWRLLARYEPAHAAGPVGERWVPWETDPRFGSMQLADDRAWNTSPGGGPLRPLRSSNDGLRETLDGFAAGRPPLDWREVAHEGDWRAQIAADLAPAVLDSGPGGPSLAPGPDPDVPAPALVRAFDRLRAIEQERESEPEAEAGWTVAGRLVETSDEWLRRLARDAAPGWTYAGTVAA